jgi:hypothetical protein
MWMLSWLESISNGGSSGDQVNFGELKASEDGMEGQFGEGTFVDYCISNNAIATIFSPKHEATQTPSS